MLDAPGDDGDEIGQLAPGTLVRVVAESYSEDSFFIRFERTDSEAATYYDAPRPPPKFEWVCVARADERFAFWSNVAGIPLSSFTETNDLDDRFSSALLDV